MIFMYVMMLILTIALNVLNSYYIPKCNMKMEKYMHALAPSVIAVLCAMFYYMFLVMFTKDTSMMSSLNIITNITTCIIFLIVNSFVIISKGIDDKKDKDVSIGLIFIFCLPIIFVISLPMTLFLYFTLKIRKAKKEEIKVTEEELFEDAISANEYSNNEISVSEYINEIKYNSNL